METVIPGLPGDPVVKNLPPMKGMEVGLIPGWGTKVPYAARQQSPSAATREPVSYNH